MTGTDYPLRNAETDAAFRKHVGMWAARIARLCELNAPTTVLTHGACCVLKRVAAFDPDGFASFLSMAFIRHARIGHELCTNCTNRAGESGLCERCDHEMEQLLNEGYDGPIPGDEE